MPVATIGDFPLELIEKIACHLNGKDVLKLMMVNKRLYAMGESIFFGKHVAEVSLGENSIDMIKKVIDSPYYIRLNKASRPFAKRIGSCDKLDVTFYAEPTDLWVLKQLKSVNHLALYVSTKEDCLKFLTNFRGSVKKKATLRIRIGSFEQEQAMKELLGKFIENQVNGCEEITLDCNFKDCFHFYREAMMKTQTKMFTIKTCFEFDKIVEWIVNQGIPSKNSEAVIHFVKQTEQGEVEDSRINSFISQAQGLERVDDGENHSALVSRANKLLRENDEDPYSRAFKTKTSCFRRRIDATMSCIYVLYTFVVSHRFGIDENPAHFLAFYMPSL